MLMAYSSGKPDLTEGTSHDGWGINSVKCDLLRTSRAWTMYSSPASHMLPGVGGAS